jgi:hypothetical protein
VGRSDPNIGRADGNRALSESIGERRTVSRTMALKMAFLQGQVIRRNNDSE